MEIFLGAYAGIRARSWPGALARACAAFLFLVALDAFLLQKLELPMAEEVPVILTGAFLRILLGATVAFAGNKWAVAVFGAQRDTGNSPTSQKRN